MFSDIMLTSHIVGERIHIPDPKIEVNISCRNCSRKEFFCEDVLVRFVSIYVRRKKQNVAD